MEQCGDSLILITAILDRDCSDPKQVGNIGNFATLPLLQPMNSARISKGIIKPLRQQGIFCFHFLPSFSSNPAASAPNSELRA
jgi:biotin carboxylase